MSKENAGDPKDRLHELGLSVAHGGRSFPTEAHNGNGHLSIQTGGYQKADLDRVLPILHELVETFELEFLGPVTDDQLRHLVGLRHILSLKLNHSGITDAGLRHLAGLTSLRVLELRGLPIVAGIEHLAGLHNLSELDLWRTRVGDEAAGVLSGLTGLTVLKLDGCPVTDRGLEQLAGLTKLRTLDLSRTQVRGPGLVALKHFADLWSLDLDGLPIADRDVEPLARLTRLHFLSLDDTGVGDAGADWLAGLTGLGRLSLNGSRIGDDALRHLAGWRELGSLSLARTRVTGAGFAHLPVCLEGLGLTGLNLGEADVVGLGHLRRLSHLSLDERVADGAVLARLRQMHLGRCRSYDEAVAAFARLPTCPLCTGIIEEGTPTYYARPFAMDAEFFSLVERPIHWDCYAEWEHRPRFARQYFRANVAAMTHNRFWGVARCDDRVLLTINPGGYVREIEGLLAETGSAFRIPMDDWQDWLDGEWFEACRHEVEREALADLVAAWRTELPTPEDVARAAGFGDREPETPRVNPMVERVCYEFACEALAKRSADKGTACPHCGRFSNEYEYRRVATVSPDGPRSCLVCKACGSEFGPVED
jgi:hypothetical protein